MKYRVVIEQDEDGIYVAEVPTLPGCISQTQSRDEALNNMKEAFELYINTTGSAVVTSYSGRMLFLRDE